MSLYYGTLRLRNKSKAFNEIKTTDPNTFCCNVQNINHQTDRSFIILILKVQTEIDELLTILFSVTYWQRLSELIF